MLTREAAGIRLTAKKNRHNTGEMPWNRGDPSSDVAIHFLCSSWKFAHTPSAVIQRGGRVAYKSYS